MRAPATFANGYFVSNWILIICGRDFNFGHHPSGFPRNLSDEDSIMNTSSMNTIGMNRIGMKTISAIAFAMSITASGYSLAAAPQLHVTKTIAIDAAATKVWDATKDFNGLNAWHPAVAKDEIVEGKNNTVGAVRVLTLQDGGTIKEKLLGFNTAGHTFTYSILEGVLPVIVITNFFIYHPFVNYQSPTTAED